MGELIPSQQYNLFCPTAGGSRNYLLHVPASYSPDTPTSLILAFHGKGQTAAEFEHQTQLSSPDFNAAAIVAYPQGINKQWTGDPESPPPSSVNDIDFACALLDDLTATYCISVLRMYAVGFSNGGGLTSLLAYDAHLSSRIAAFAIASGAMYRDEVLKGGTCEPLFDRCNSSRSPIPVLEFHGSRDPVIHYDGMTTPDGPTYSIPEWLEGWVTRNGCSNDQGEKSELYEGKAERTIWRQKATNEPRGEDSDVVEHYYIHGFGHGWPSKIKQDDDDQRYGPTVFDATPVILDFFERHCRK